MSYLLHATKKRNRHPFRKLLIVLVCCLILGFFAREFISQTALATGLWFKSVLNVVVPSGLRTDAELLSENERLQGEVVRLTAENADRGVLDVENQNLKFELGRKENASTTKSAAKKGILAIVRSKPAETPFDTFMLDAGMDSGVVIGDNVYYGNLVIGTIVDVGAAFSKAELFSSPGKEFAGTVTAAKLKIDVKGLGGGLFESLVPEGAQIKIGDAIVLPSIKSKVFAVVSQIEDKQAEGFKRLLFTLPVNPNQLSEVTISK
ncbi:MAG: hypothetical protein JWP09_148 [Candidatus Taylorbacteria bacterium]|nr:hypothetical protein [Candidatus Taylorbacteria bacterium]